MHRTLRTRIVIENAQAIDWSHLRASSRYLYRRIADQDRAVLGVGVHRDVDAPEFGADGAVGDWVFGAMRYEWKDALEPAFFGSAIEHSQQHCTWFVPRFVVEWNGAVVCMHVLPGDEQMAVTWSEHFFCVPANEGGTSPFTWEEHCTRETYVANVEDLLAHIRRGDIYEVNYCTERTAVATWFDPYAAFGRLLARSGAPYAAFYQNGDEFALCASPERFLAFNGDRVMGQPMKGTRPRSADQDEDARLAAELASDAKERSENIMALDVMRNDLSRVAASGSVRVEALCQVVSFPRVHQMISTVEARLRSGLTPMDAIRAAFPMASMTGAPKVRAMQLIEEAELAPRGLFSGSLGFFAPDGTGDLNVVIRTVLYNRASGSASISTGSAITVQCDPVLEWEECQLKARSVIDAIAHA